jgi:hypothetical protein
LLERPDATRHRCDNLSEATAAPKSPAKKAQKDVTEEPIAVHVVTMNGESHAFEASPSSTLSEFKAMICDKLGHPTGSQRLLLGSLPLLDARRTLHELGVVEGAVLTLVILSEPLGQSLLEKPTGKKDLCHQGSPAQALNEFELQSWRTAFAADRIHEGVWSAPGYEDEDHPWGNTGWGGVQLYWATPSDGCRYEYWSTDPGDNEYGILIRVDDTSMRAIGSGSDDGLELFAECLDEFGENDAIMQLCFTKKLRFDHYDSDDESDEESDEEE